MGKKLYVGNLAYGVTDSALQQMFESFGSVESAQVIIDRDTGRSKGFGFVEMSKDTEAQAAIQAMNGKEIEGRPLTVNEARPKRVVAAAVVAVAARAVVGAAAVAAVTAVAAAAAAGALNRSLTYGDRFMGNPAGLRAKQRQKRHKREVARLALKSASTTAKAESAEAATPKK